MDPSTLITPAQNTWCPGCGNFSIEHALKDTLASLIEGGLAQERIVLIYGDRLPCQRCDYLGVNSVYAIHGRAIPVATGLVLANPDLMVICCAGDGDAYGEGLDHLIFAAKRNVGITCIIHDNRVYGLTTGQYTNVTPRLPRTVHHGERRAPSTHLTFSLPRGATFIARAYTWQIPHLKAMIQEAILHPDSHSSVRRSVQHTTIWPHTMIEGLRAPCSGHRPGGVTPSCSGMGLSLRCLSLSAYLPVKPRYRGILTQGDKNGGEGCRNPGNTSLERT